MQHEHYTHTAPDIPPSTALSIFFFLLHFLLMQLLFFLLVPFQDFLHSLLCSRPILHTGQFDQQITHDHSIMGTANDKSYDTTHDNLEDDTHQYIHQVSHQDSTPSAVILHLIPHFQLVQKRILRKRVKHIILDRTAYLEQAAVLEHKGNGVHQFFLGDIPHIRFAHPDAAALHIEEPVDKVCQRGFAAAGGAYKSHGLSRLNVQRNALDDLGFSVIAEMHIL